MPLPRITLEGRVVADPELRFSPSGVAVAKIRVVANDRRKNDAGEWEDGDTLWMTVTVFKKLAENVAESVAKSDIIIVTGKIKTDEWTTEAGEKRSAVSMIADTVSPSLQFRTIPHGSGYRDRAESSSAPADSTPPEIANSDEPPF
jgi:single-strand DNA-binding protein